MNRSSLQLLHWLALAAALAGGLGEFAKLQRWRWRARRPHPGG